MVFYSAWVPGAGVTFLKSGQSCLKTGLWGTSGSWGRCASSSPLLGPGVLGTLWMGPQYRFRVHPTIQQSLLHPKNSMLSELEQDSKAVVILPVVGFSPTVSFLEVLPTQY